MISTATKLSKEIGGREYPLLVDNGELVVMATNNEDGMVLMGGEEFKIADWLECRFNFDEWAIFNGTLTLEND